MDYKLLLQALLNTGMKQEELARELGTSQPNIARWLRGMEPRGTTIEAIKHLAREHGIISENAAEIPSRARTSSKGDIPSLTIHGGAGNGGSLHIETQDNGAPIDPDMTDGFWSFPEGVRKSWPAMNKCYAFPVIGDSMAPTLASGSFVFVDITHTVPSPSDIYAIDAGDGLVIKRVELVPQSETVKIISDNPQYSTYELLRQDVRVYGRFRAWFQWRG